MEKINELRFEIYRNVRIKLMIEWYLEVDLMQELGLFLINIFKII